MTSLNFSRIWKTCQIVQKGFAQEAPFGLCRRNRHRGAHGIESTFRRYLPFEFLGIKSVARNLKGEYVLIDKEMLLVWDPDITSPMEAGSTSWLKRTLEKIQNFIKICQLSKMAEFIWRYPIIITRQIWVLVLANVYFIGKVVIPLKL